MPRNTAKPLPETSTAEGRTAADKRAEDKRKLDAARKAFVAVPQNVKVLTELAKR